MATQIFVDQENDQVCAPKSQLRLPSVSSKALSEKTQVNTPLPKKAISASPVPSRSVRKALGNVNATEGVTSKLDNIKQKNQPCTLNKTNEKIGMESCHIEAEEDWPEIEKIFPLGPEDFDSFDLPEEYRLSNINLCGVPLMVFERPYDLCVNRLPSPMETEMETETEDEETSWMYSVQTAVPDILQSTADFLATLDKIIEMPSPDFDV